MREFTDQEIVRREKLKNLEKSVKAYPERYVINYEIKEAINLPDETKDVSVAGRIILMRKMGKLSFLTISNVEAKIQISIKCDVVGEEQYSLFKNIFDLGDFIGVCGEIFTTHTGEKTIRANSFQFLGKALRPLPEKFHGLEDIEAIYRHRYLDLIMNEDARKRFLVRSQFIKEMRNYLNDHNYIEIETPILNNQASGALARPFTTHHNALDIDLYLRIAVETYLKRAVIGGFTKVYEIARCFRNEGVDATHLQDFTMIEGYCAFYNYRDNMIFLKEMLQTIINNIFNTLVINIGDKVVDLSGDWEEISFRDIILKYSNIDIDKYNTKELLYQKIIVDKIEIESETPLEDLGFGNLVDQLYKKVARPNIIKPTFLTSHPISLSPLARGNDDNENIVDRFQLIINGAEIINAYSELVDPVEQEKRLREQMELREQGDEEAMQLEEDYIEAMEYGMPPISGWGIGIDRVIQLITNSANIKDCVMFPLMRPEKNKE